MKYSPTIHPTPTTGDHLSRTDAARILNNMRKSKAGFLLRHKTVKFGTQYHYLIKDAECLDAWTIWTIWTMTGRPA